MVFRWDHIDAKYQHQRSGKEADYNSFYSNFFHFSPYLTGTHLPTQSKRVPDQRAKSLKDYFSMMFKKSTPVFPSTSLIASNRLVQSRRFQHTLHFELHSCRQITGYLSHIVSRYFNFDEFGRAFQTVDFLE